jgi:hypothetical protein
VLEWGAGRVCLHGVTDLRARGVGKCKSTEGSCSCWYRHVFMLMPANHTCQFVHGARP